MPTALRAAVTALAQAGLASPRVDAELLLCQLLGCRRSQLVLAGELTDAQQADYTALIRRRAAGVPLQHLTGRAPFRHLDLAVGPGVFIPRPETELIVELAADALARARIAVDLCAGSGAIALSVAQEYRSVAVTAVERSAAALEWLRRNAAAQQAAGDPPIEIVAADIADPDLLPGLTGQVDVLLTNPPYVPQRLRAELAVEVGHDPAEAVFAGPDGLDLMPDLLVTAARLLQPGGQLVIEHDASHAASLLALISADPCWQNAIGQPDLTGRPRFVSAARSSAAARP